MRHRLLIGGYLAAVVALTSVHEPGILAGALLVVLVTEGRGAWRLARRVLLAVLLFNSVVSITYAAVSLADGRSPVAYLLLLNLRVLALTSLSFAVFRRVDWLRAARFSRNLTFLLVLVMSQIRILRRTREELGLALRSRSIGRLGLRDLYRHAAASGSFFLERAHRDAEEITLAMRSRGFFDA